MQLHIRVCSAASTPPPSASSSCRQTSRATDRSAERQTDRSAERQTDQQSDRQSCRGLPPSPTCLVSIRRSLSAVLVRSASSGPCARSASPSSRWSSSCSRPGSAPQTPATRGRAQLRPAAPWDCLRFCSAATVYKICAWLQLTADSWESPEMRALCGDSVCLCPGGQLLSGFLFGPLGLHPRHPGGSGRRHLGHAGLRPGQQTGRPAAAGRQGSDHRSADVSVESPGGGGGGGGGANRYPPLTITWFPSCCHGEERRGAGSVTDPMVASDVVPQCFRSVSEC
ncbi:uncharacterized protein lhfpl4b isoform X2 [Larimichthys crocea]|uniref:uncharacterized protein lhfpl4b isoform X2 n=1 Tax=Larimichthys crocea TaxID=215358 RepID=UPI000F5F29E1|nr:uncharacterized protein LOC113744740 isoform X2 [Larimichthys crocea]